MRKIGFSKILIIWCAIWLATSPFVSSALAGRRGPDFKPMKVEEEVSGDDITAPEGTDGGAFSLSLDKIDSTEQPGNKDMSLDDCIKLALERNAKLKAAGYDVEAAKGQLIEAKASYWPVLDYTYRMAPVPTDVNHALRDFFKWEVTLFNSLHVGVGVPIASFGQLHTVKNLAEGGVEAAKINEGKVRENTIYQVKQLYYGVQLAKELIKLLQDAVQKLGDKISDEEAKEQKDMDPYDLLQLKLTKVDLERRVDETRSNLELAYEGLRIQLDLDPGVDVGLDSDNLRPVVASLIPEQDYIDTAMRSQPEAKLLEIGVQTKRLQYKLEKFKLLPAGGFGFFADIGRAMGNIKNITDVSDYNNPFNYTRAGVGLQFKGTIDFHGAYGRIKKARSEYYKAMFERLIGRRALSLDIRKAYLATKRAQDDVRRAKKAEAMARQMTFISKVNVDMGIGENQRYGDSLKMLLLTRGVYFKAVFDYNIALADLAQRIGVAKYEEVMPPPGIEEYDAFDSGDNEGFETFEGVEQNTNTKPDVKIDINKKGESDEDKL